MKTIDSHLLSEFILVNSPAMDHLKLQKLLYYVQGWHLAYFDEPLIDDDFEAWMHGPVSRKVWNKFKSHSILFNDIEVDKSKSGKVNTAVKGTLTKDQCELIADVLLEYGKMTSYGLEKLTHSEEPWVSARKGKSVADVCDEVITKDSIKQYFKSLLNNVK